MSFYKVVVHVTGNRHDDLSIHADRTQCVEGKVQFWRHDDSVNPVAVVSMDRLIYMRLIDVLPPPDVELQSALLADGSKLEFPPSREKVYGGTRRMRYEQDPILDAARDAASRLVLPVTAPSQVRYEKYDLAQGGVIASSSTATEGELGPNC